MAAKLKNLKPTDPEVTARILKRIDAMSAEELLAFVMYRTPGVEETNMTGMFSNGKARVRSARPKGRVLGG